MTYAAQRDPAKLNMYPRTTNRRPYALLHCPPELGFRNNRLNDDHIYHEMMNAPWIRIWGIVNCVY